MDMATAVAPPTDPDDTSGLPVPAPPLDTALPDDPLAQLRPRMRQDVVFAQTEDGAFLRHAESGFVMKGKTAYRWVSALVPYFTGEHTVAELSAGLDPKQQQLIASMVRTLLERGFVRDGGERDSTELPAAVARRYDSQLNFVEHYAGDNKTRFLRFRTTRVLVAGAGAAAVAAAESLLRNGAERVEVELDPRHAEADLDRLVAQAQDATADGAPAAVVRGDVAQVLQDPARLRGYDIVVAFADGAGASMVRRLVEALPPDGPALLPVTVVGARVVLGPLTRHGTPGCWICAMLRLAANLPAGELADLWRATALPGLPAARRLAADIPARMIGNAAAFEVFRYRTGALPMESDGAVLVQDLVTLDAVREPLLPHPLCPTCRTARYPDTPPPGTLTGQQSLERLLALVAGHAGVFSGFDDGAVDQSPLKVGRVRLGPADRASRPARTIAAFDLHTTADARRRAMSRAALAYLEQVADPQAGVASVPAGARAVAPAALTTASGLAPQVPTRWLAAVSLRTGAIRYVPAGAVHPGGPHNGGCFELTSAGGGAGADRDEAVRDGLGSALAYHALREAIAGRPVYPVATPAPVAEDSPAGFLVRAARAYGIDPHLYALPAPAGFPVVLAVGDPLAAGGAGTGPAPWSVGTGAGAVLDALRDLVGVAQLDEAGLPVDLGDPLLAEFDPATLRIAAQEQELADGPLDALDAVELAGLDALAVDVTSADLRATGVMHAVRVLLARGDGS